jgi:hypothetical protein
MVCGVLLAFCSLYARYGMYGVFVVGSPTSVSEAEMERGVMGTGGVHVGAKKRLNFV